MYAALAVWLLVFLGMEAHRGAFEYKEIEEQPLKFREGKRLFAGIHWAALGVFFFLAARSSDLKAFVGCVCVAAVAHIALDWWTYRRALRRKARILLETRRNGSFRQLLEEVGLPLPAREWTPADAMEVARSFLSEKALGGEYEKRKRKKAWLAFLLAVAFGPFGFLYYRWRVWLAITLAILPWSVLAQTPLRDALWDPRFRYPLQIGLGLIAFLDVARTNDKIP